MTLNAERVTFTKKKKKTVACPCPWHRLPTRMRICFRLGQRSARDAPACQSRGRRPVGDDARPHR